MSKEQARAGALVLLPRVPMRWSEVCMIDSDGVKGLALGEAAGSLDSGVEDLGDQHLRHTHTQTHTKTPTQKHMHTTPSES